MASQKLLTFESKRRRLKGLVGDQWKSLCFWDSVKFFATVTSWAVNSNSGRQSSEPLLNQKFWNQDRSEIIISSFLSQRCWNHRFKLRTVLRSYVNLFLNSIYSQDMSSLKHSFKIELSQLQETRSKPYSCAYHNVLTSLSHSLFHCHNYWSFSTQPVITSSV